MKTKVSYYRNRKPKGAQRITWTPTRIEQALRMASQGQLLKLSDFAQEVNKDDRVGGCMETRVGTVGGLPITFEHKNPRVVEAINRDWPLMVPEVVLTSVQWWGDMVGSAPSAIHPYFDANVMRWLPIVDPWHPRTLIKREGEWLIRTADGQEPVSGDGWWLYLPYGDDEPWEWALIQSLADLWLQSRYTDLDWTSWSERHGRPVPIGTAPAGAPEPDMDSFEADVKATAQAGSMVMREGYRVEYLEPRNESWRGFDARMSKTHERIAVRTLGQNLTTMVRGGSLAAANVHDQIRLGVLKSMVEKLSTALRDGPLSLWMRWNFGSEDAPYPRWNLSRQLTTVEAAKSDEAVFGAVKAARAVEAPLDEAAYYQERGIQVKRG